jgi:hypothetical protein
MKIAWYIAPIAGLIGKKGGNIGHDLTVPFCGVAFPVFRWLEMRWTGKQSIGMPLNDVDCYTGSVLLEDLPDSGTFTMLCSVQAVGFQTANPDVGGGYVLCASNAQSRTSSSQRLIMQWFYHTLTDLQASRFTAEQTSSAADRIAPPNRGVDPQPWTPIGLGLAHAIGSPAARRPNVVLFHLIVLQAPAVFSLRTAHSLSRVSRTEQSIAASLLGPLMNKPLGGVSAG